MILERSEIIAQIEQRLAEQTSAAMLAEWALDKFYALDQAQLAVAEADSGVIADVLDELMFADDARFALDEADLRRLLARLQSP
jgi:hypothetical protein